MTKGQEWHIIGHAWLVIGAISYFHPSFALLCFLMAAISFILAWRAAP